MTVEGNAGEEKGKCLIKALEMERYVHRMASDAVQLKFKEW